MTLARRALSAVGMQQLLEAYIALWMAGDDILSMCGHLESLKESSTML